MDEWLGNNSWINLCKIKLKLYCIKQSSLNLSLKEKLVKNFVFYLPFSLEIYLLSLIFKTIIGTLNLIAFNSVCISFDSW